MLVDDDDMIRAYLRLMLRDLGVENILEAGTSEKALREMKLKKIDLMFLDINLPDADGIEFTKIIKANQPDCDIIMISAEVTVARVNQITQSAANDFIAKPFNANVIEKKLSKILANLST
jgi:two-component system, chemotaxis family, chemotaxis protein CheY